MVERVIEGVVRAAARSARGSVGLESGMPWAALNANRDRLEIKTSIPRRSVAEEPPLVPVDPHSIEASGGSNEHWAMPEVSGDLAQPTSVLLHGRGRGQQRLGTSESPRFGVSVPESLGFGVWGRAGQRLKVGVPRAESLALGRASNRANREKRVWARNGAVGLDVDDDVAFGVGASGRHQRAEGRGYVGNGGRGNWIAPASAGLSAWSTRGGFTSLSREVDQPGSIDPDAIIVRDPFQSLLAYWERSFAQRFLSGRHLGPAVQIRREQLGEFSSERLFTRRPDDRRKLPERDRTKPFPSESVDSLCFD